MTAAYCDLCDLPLDQCPHGRPEPVAAPVAPRKVPAAKAPARRSSGTASPRVQTRRVAGAGRTPQALFRPVILTVLREVGGRGEADEVLAEVERRMAAGLKPADYDEVQGEARWRRAARFERKEMVEDGLLEPVRERGVWQLSTRGLTED